MCIFSWSLYKSILYLSAFCIQITFLISCSDQYGVIYSKNNNQDLINIPIDSNYLFPHAQIDSVAKVKFMEIELDSSKTLSVISKLLVIDDSNILIVDKIRNEIYLVDAKGNFLRRIGSRGPSYGQYLEITDVSYDRHEKIINVFSLPNRKMLAYDLSADLISERTSNYDLLTFFKTPDGFLIYGCFENNIRNPYLSRSEVNKANLLSVSDDLSDITGDYLHSNNFYDRMNNNDNFIQGKNDTLYFHYGYNDTIYSIIDHQIVPHFKLDFGIRTLPHAVMASYSNRKVFDNEIVSRANPYTGMITQMAIGEKLIYLDYSSYSLSINFDSRKVLFFFNNGETKFLPKQLGNVIVDINRILTIYAGKIYFEIVPRSIPIEIINTLNQHFDLHLTQKSNPLLLVVDENDIF